MIHDLINIALTVLVVGFLVSLMRLILDKYDR